MGTHISERTKKWPLRHYIDFSRFRAVIFESDDWGACEFSKDESAMNEFSPLFASREKVIRTLERKEDLDKLYRVLRRHNGEDGIPANFTAFMCVGNPDYTLLGKNEFSKYEDIGIDQGFSEGWERPGVTNMWKEGYDEGLFQPEFHSNLHHTSPKLWLRKLRSDDPGYRTLFDWGSYMGDEHLPEYEDMNVREQHEWITTGMARFIRTFGFVPVCAVTSDAMPITEIVWALNGIRTVCLKNSRTNNGAVVVYDNKPWNNQDTYAPIGAYDEEKDLIYLTRNIFFENESVDEVAPLFKDRWERLNEPAVVSTHRCNYVSLDSEFADHGLRKLDALLDLLSKDNGTRFITSGEMGELYRQGWSARKVKDATIVRKWSETAEPIVLENVGNECRSLPEGKTYYGVEEREKMCFDLPLGDYVVAQVEVAKASSF